MILVDVSFILELFFRCRSVSWTSNDAIFVQPRANVVMLDLLLLENQLPFFVIEKLHQLAFPSLFDADSYLSNYNDFLKLCINSFGHSNVQSIQAHPNMKIEYLTDLPRTYQLPPPRSNQKETLN